MSEYAMRDLHRASIFLTCFSVLLSAVECQSHVGDYIFPIFELAPSQLPILNDGSLEDWEDALPNASLTDRDFSMQVGTRDAADLAFRVFLGWTNTEQQLYLAVERLDDVFLPYGDGFEFQVDGDHSGGIFWWSPDDLANEDEVRARNGNQAQWYALGQNQATGEIDVRPANEGRDWAQQAPFIDYSVASLGESPSMFVSEMTLTPWDRFEIEGPESSLRSELYPGKVIGFAMNLFDGDEPRSPDGPVKLSGWYIFPPRPAGTFVGLLNSADLFADGELIPCDLAGCSSTETVVEADSWARIKASMAGHR